jgi:hypothetical protein
MDMTEMNFLRSSVLHCNNNETPNLISLWVLGRENKIEGVRGGDRGW